MTAEQLAEQARADVDQDEDERVQHEHHFGTGEPDENGFVDPADCECGTTYQDDAAEQAERAAADHDDEED